MKVARPALVISYTGLGEEIIEEGLAVWMAQRVADGATLAGAFALTFRALRSRHRRIGAIGLDRYGRVVGATTLPMLFAIAQTSGRSIESF